VLERLAKSKKYALQYKEEAERLMQKGREEGIKIGLQKGEERGLEKGKKIGIKEGQELGAVQKAIQMAKGMKKKGIDVKVIAEVSKLSISQIRKL
jgi:predicted transposase YdaD